MTINQVLLPLRFYLLHFGETAEKHKVFHQSFELLQFDFFLLSWMLVI